MNAKEITLVAKQICYLSAFDEEAFFNWLGKIKGLIWKGVGNEIHIGFRTSNVSDVTMRELIALFFRYKIDLRQLVQLVDESNKGWISNPKSYWFDLMWKEIVK